MIPDVIADYIYAFAGDPVMLGIALALATLVSEDGALVTGALLVGSDMASASVIIFWVTLGIVGGDIGLYWLGATARQNVWIRRRVPVRRAASVRRWLKDRDIAVLFLSRLMPGMRLPTYVSYGFLGMSLVRFGAVMLVAGLLWVTAMVIFVQQIQAVLSQAGGTVGVVGAIIVAFVTLYGVPAAIKRRNLIPAIPSEPEAGAKNTEAKNTGAGADRPEP